MEDIIELSKYMKEIIKLAKYMEKNIKYMDNIKIYWRINRTIKIHGRDEKETEWWYKAILLHYKVLESTVLDRRMKGKIQNRSALTRWA